MSCFSRSVCPPASAAAIAVLTLTWSLSSPSSAIWSKSSRARSQSPPRIHAPIATLKVMVDLSCPSRGMVSKSSSARSHSPPLEHALIVALYTMVLVSTPWSRMASNISTHLLQSPFFRHLVENIVNARGSRRMGASLSFSAAAMTAATPPSGALRISCATSYTRPPGVLPRDGLNPFFLFFLPPFIAGLPMATGEGPRASSARKNAADGRSTPFGVV